LNKVMTFLRATAGADRDEFQRSILALARNGLDARIGAGALTVNLVLPPLPGLPYRPPSDPTAGSMPEYDAIVEAWGAQAASALKERLSREVGGQCGVLHSYAVTHTTIYDRRPFPRGQPSEGIKLIGRLMFHADLPDSAARRSWGLHARLAARVHVGSAIYAQNWVDADLGNDCPPARGMPIMHFPTETDFFKGFVDSPRGMEEIIQDTSHFVAGGPRFYATEYIIRPHAD
jgi:hypothetical protein